MKKETLTIRKKLVFCLIALAIVVAADVGLAQIAKFGFNWFEEDESAKKELYRVPSPVYHHGFSANSTGTSTWGDDTVPFFSNSLGFRDSEIREVPLIPEGARVLLIGDAFIEGVGIPFDDTVTGVIRKELSKQDIDVQDASTVSYCPAIYFAKSKHLLETVGLEFDALAVFIDMSDISDEANFYVVDEMDHVVKSRITHGGGTPDASQSIAGRVKSLVKNNSVVGHTISVLRNRAQQRANADTRTEREKAFALGNWIIRWAYDEKSYEKYGKLGLENADKNMDRLLELTRKHDVALTVVVYPWTDQIDQRDIECKQVTFWREWTRERDVPFINLFPTLINDESTEDVFKKYFIPGDAHWNASGHRLIAEAFLSEFTPPSGKPKSD